MLKRSGTFILLACLLSTPVRANLKVFACEPEWAQLASDIGGEHVTVFSATTAQQDVHHIQARPSLIAKLRRADLLVCSGAGLEAGWLPVLLRRANNGRVLPGEPGYLDMSHHAALRDVPESVDRSHGDVHPEGNPHFQLDPRQYASFARILGERMARLDADNATDYRAAVEDFQQQWENLLTQWQDQSERLQGVNVVVHHKDWVYLFDWLGLAQVVTLEPKPGVPPSSGHLARVLESLRAQPAACVIRTVYQPEKPSAWLAGRTRINSVVIPHTVGADDTVQTFPQLFDEIINRLQANCL